MIKKQITFVVYLLLFILQFSGIILAFVLEDLSSKKMGVARYLLYKEQVFETIYFTSSLLKVYTFIFLVGAIVCLLLLMIKGKGRKLSISLLLTAIANLIGIIFIQFKLQLDAYHFFLIGIFIVIAFQYIWITILFLKRIRKKSSTKNDSIL